MSRETVSKPLPRAFALLAVALLAVCALGGAVALASEDSEGATSAGKYFSGTNNSSSSKLYTLVNGSINELYSKGTFYVAVGAWINVGGDDTYTYNTMGGTATSYGLSIEGGMNTSSCFGTVSKAGSFTVEASGTSGKITVNFTAVSVTQVTSISWGGPTTVAVGSSITVTATTNSTAFDRGVSISGSSSSLASVSSSTTSTGGSATVTAKKAGTLTLTAEASFGSYSSTRTITIVEPTPVTSIALNWTLSSSSSVFIGNTTSIRAVCSPSNASDMTVSWSLSNGCATISREWNDTYNNVYRNGVDIKGVSVGTVVLTATANDGSGVSKSVTITVREPTYYYNLNFDMNGGTGGPDDMQKNTSDTTSTLSFTIPSTKPTRDGYTFLGWSKSSSATSASYQPGDKISVTYDDVTLYAVWQLNKQYYYAYLYYNANGGSGAPSTQSDSIYASSASGSKTFTIPSTKPSKSGFDFLGWSTSSTATTASYQPGSTISVSYDSSKTLYAVWKEKTYTCTLSFSANGGSGTPSALTYTGTSTSSHMFTIPSTIPVKSGFVFLGWSTSSTATSASYQPGSTISVPYDGSKTLYAVWQTAQLDITSEPATKSLKVGQSWSYTPTTNVSGCTVTVSGADWLSVSNGKIGGTPATAGTYDVTVTVSKDGYASDTQTFTLKVYSALGFNSVPGANGMFAYAE